MKKRDVATHDAKSNGFLEQLVWRAPDSFDNSGDGQWHLTQVYATETVALNVFFQSFLERGIFP
jgi:hypothetical protein